MSIFECKVSLPEIKDFIKDLVLVPENIFKLIRRDIKEPVGKFLTKMMEAELTIFLGRQKYERIKGKRERNYRNGYTTKTVAIKGIGGIRVQFPRLIVELFPSIRERRKNLAEISPCCF